MTRIACAFALVFVVACGSAAPDVPVGTLQLMIDGKPTRYPIEVLQIIEVPNPNEPSIQFELIGAGPNATLVGWAGEVPITEWREAVDRAFSVAQRAGLPRKSSSINIAEWGGEHIASGGFLKIEKVDGDVVGGSVFMLVLEGPKGQKQVNGTFKARGRIAPPRRRPQDE